MIDIVDELRIATVKDADPWDVKLYERAADEIEHLRTLITEWADAEAKYCEREYMEDWPALESAASALRKTVGR